jgi:DNA-binding CsgD family transcriptional regulator
LTFAIAAFLESAFGQEVRAQRAARRARQAAKTRRERALAQAAHAAMRSARPGGRGEAVQILERAGLRGYARLFDIASVTVTPRHEHVALSDLECELLRAYCARRSAKDIASETGRNVNTVRAHVRNISRKLAASGRDDLIAIATARSLL